MSPGRVPHQHDMVGIAAELLHVPLNPRDRASTILIKRREMNLWVQSVVRDDSDDASLGERRSDEPVV